MATDVITRENFLQMYPVVKEKILTASFISIDEEMSGIMSPDWQQRNKKHDDPDGRYAKMVPVAKRYAIIQFGLCCWHEVTLANGEQGMEASPFTFYIFADNGPDVTLSSSSIAFLRNNHMDFGKWITSGCNYANEKEEAYLKTKFLEVEVNKTASEKIVLTKPSDIDFLAKNVEKLNTFLSNIQTNDEITNSNSNSNSDPTINHTIEASTTSSSSSSSKKSGGAPEFLFDKCNPYLRRVLYQYIEEHHPSLTVSKSIDDRVRILVLDEAEKKNHLKQLVEEEKKKFSAAMGFRSVFNDLVACKKPIIGHNCFFDFLFMMTWFDGPLPELLSDFKVVVGCEHTELGELYKYMVAPGSSTVDTDLSPSPSAAAATEVGLELASIPSVPIQMAAGFEHYTSDTGGQLHDAGWDAYLTGSIFYQQARSMGSMEALVTKANNKLFMMQSLYHMNLDPVQPNGWIKIQGVVIYVGNFTVDVKTEHIIACFTKGGFSLNALEVIWIDGQSTFVAVNDQGNNGSYEGGDNSGISAADHNNNSSSSSSTNSSNSKLTGEMVIARMVLPEDCQWLVQTYEQYKTPPDLSLSSMIVPLPPVKGIDVEVNHPTTSGVVSSSNNNDTAMVVDQSTISTRTMSPPGTTKKGEDVTIVPVEKRPRLN